MITIYFLIFFLSMRIIATFVGEGLGKLTGFMSTAANVLNWVCIVLAVLTAILLVLSIWDEIRTDKKTHRGIRFGILFVFALGVWICAYYLTTVSTFMITWDMYYLLIMVCSAVMFVAVLLIDILKSIFKGRKRRGASAVKEDKV